MNSTEIGKTVPFMFANECRKPSGKSCCHPDNGTPIGGAVVHLHTRSHTTSSSVMDLLRPLLEAGLVTREKVDQRVLWSLAPDYVREQRQLATRSAAILARELGDVASPSDK